MRRISSDEIKVYYSKEKSNLNLSFIREMKQADNAKEDKNQPIWSKETILRIKRECTQLVTITRFK